MHIDVVGTLEHHHVAGSAGEREGRTGRSGEGQRSRRKGAGRVEIRTGRGGLAVVVNFADLKVDIVTLRILGVDYDAGHGVVGQVVSGGEGLSVISVKGGTRIAVLLRIADQGPAYSLCLGGSCQFGADDSNTGDKQKCCNQNGKSARPTNGGVQHDVVLPRLPEKNLGSSGIGCRPCPEACFCLTNRQAIPLWVAM